MWKLSRPPAEENTKPSTENILSDCLVTSQSTLLENTQQQHIIVTIEILTAWQLLHGQHRHYSGPHLTNSIRPSSSLGSAQKQNQIIKQNVNHMNFKFMESSIFYHISWFAGLLFLSCIVTFSRLIHWTSTLLRDWLLSLCRPTFLSFPFAIWFARTLGEI